MTVELWDYARGVVCLAFALAVVGKARDLGGFVHGVRSLGLLPRRLAAPVAGTVVALELAVVVAMLPGGAWTVAGLVLATAQLLVYTAALAVAMRRQGDVRCACFGPGTRPVTPVHLVRNGILGAIAAAGILAGVPHPAPAAADAALVLGPAAATALLLAALDDVVALARTPLHTD